MSSNTQNLSSAEIKSNPILRLDTILESNLGKILDPVIPDASKTDAARTIITKVRQVMPKKHRAITQEENVQAAVKELQGTIVLDALSAVQDWAGDRLHAEKQDAGSTGLDKRTLRWINSRATNLDFVIGNRAGALSGPSGASPV